MAAKWGDPLQKLDKSWVSIEQRLAVWVVVLEISALVFWVSLKGLAAYYTPGGNVIGVIFRSILGAIILGGIAHLITRKKSAVLNGAVVTIAVFIGLALGPTWANTFGDWSTNMVGWLQNASALALIGGPRGLVTRLTLLVALLGGSMAASKGKHINIDVAVRYVPVAFVKPIAIVGMATASIVCFLASFGFVDSIAVTKFRAEAFRSCDTSPSGVCDTAVSERLGVVAEEMSTDFFLLRRQLSLDLSSFPRAIIGEPYDKYLTAKEWNAWVKEGGWNDHFPETAVASLILPEDDPKLTKMPMVTAPTTGEGRDLLIRDLNFILPFGLMVIALKFLLRILLALSGHVKIDPDAAHDDEDLKAGHEAPEGAAR